MSRSETKRKRRRLIRLSILAGVALLIAGSLLALYQANKGKRDHNAQAIFDQARQAYEQQDHARVLQLLEEASSPGYTIGQIRDNPQMLKCYVEARKQSPLPGGEHLLRIVPALQQIVRLDPKDEKARHELLDLLLRMQRFAEARQLAQTLLKKFADDTQLWRALGASFVGIGSPSKALEAYREAGQREPMHVDTQVQILRLMQENMLDLAPFIASAKALLSEHPTDPRAEAIGAMAAMADNDFTRAKALLQSASDRPPTDDNFVSLLVQWLDRAEMFSQSRDYVNRLAQKGIDTYAGREAVYRTFDVGDMQGVINLLKPVDLTQAHADLLAMGAMAWHAQADPARARELIAILDRRTDPLAQAWATVLPLVLDEQTQPGKIIDAITGILTPESDLTGNDQINRHPYLYHLLGEAYLQAQEQQLAIEVFTVAAQLRPSWARPLRLLALTLLSQNRPNQALVCAQGAWRRQGDIANTTLLVRSQLAAADAGDAQAVDALIQQADALLVQLPDEPDVLPAAVDLLARSGRLDQARQRIAGALRLDPAPSARLLMALSAQSQRYELGMTDAIHALLREQGALSPGIVLEQALSLAQAGQIEQGRALIEQASQDQTDLDWRLARGQYLAAVGDEQARAYWIALADEQEANMEIQLQALATTTVRGDAAFAERAITRLRQIGGQTSIRWRVEQARVWMQDGASDATLLQARDILQSAQQLAPTVLEIPLELARCSILLGDTSAAENSARQAKELMPAHAGATLLLGQLLHQQGRVKESRIELLAVAANSQASAGMRIDACEMLYEQGERRAVRDTLESLDASGRADQNALLLLARTYIAMDQVKQADALCTKLLQNADLETTLFVASYYQQTGRPELAEQTRSVATAALSEADRLTLAAQQWAQQGNATEALRQIVAAAEAEPTQRERWRTAARLAILTGEVQEALALARRGLGQAGEDPGLRALIDHQQLLEQIKQDNAVSPLAAALLSDATQRDSAIAAMKLVLSETDPSKEALGLTELARSVPSFQALHELAGQRLFDAGLYRDAYNLASRAMVRFPESVATAKTAALAAYRLADWVSLRSAATAWGQRSADDRALSDLMIAAADDALQQFDAVIRTLEPLLPQLTGAIDDHAQYYLLYTRALVRVGQADRAWSLLQPHLLSSPSARDIALQLLSDDLPDAAVTRTWLDAIARLTGDADDATFELARSIYMASMRLNDPALLQAAGRTIDQLLLKPGTHRTDAYALHGQIAQSLGDLPAAESSFRKVALADPENPHVMNNLAMVLLMQGSKVDEAEQLALRATGVSKDDPNLLDTLALVRLRLGKLTLAEQAITRAIHLDPENPAWRLTQADILEAQGQNERAQAIRERYAQTSVD